MKKRHWSFVVCDPRCLYPVVALLMVCGVGHALQSREAYNFNRVGNLVIGTGVWMSMRFTLRQGIKRYKNLADSVPVVPGTSEANAAFFNEVTFAIGDERLQLHGFALVVLGSLVGSYGDMVLKAMLPGLFRT